MPIRALTILAASGWLFHHLFCERPPMRTRKDKKLRDNLSEKQVDHMIEDSFPASDPPSTY